MDIKEIVKYVLIKHPLTRGDDMRLIYDVFKVYNPNIDTMELKSIMYYHKILELPSIASIIRYRRALQKEYPELEANSKVKEGRAMLEAEYQKHFKR